VRRVLGRGPGNLVFALDALKGALAAGLPLLFALYYVRAHPQAAGGPGPLGAPANDHAARLAVGLGYVGLALALVGHSFSCFTRLRGGKGVATAAGGLLVLMPAVALISAAVWVYVFYSTRYVTLASILGALSLPLLAFLITREPVDIWVSALIALFVAVRHRANVLRLLNGTEKKFERRRPDGPPPGGGP
jgi:glycerol-3-phosphate acyltransferase PlsY